MTEIKILDACCGGKMFWFNKHEPHTTYLDNRSGTFYFLDRGQTRSINIEPNVVGDFRKMPFDDETVIEYHPAKENYVNIAENCLHLWRPQKQAIPVPPKSFV